MATLIVFAFGRWNLLARNGRRLVASASTLPRSYVVGAGSPLRMVVLGDSTAAGVGAGSLEATLAYQVAMGLGGRIEVTNLAVSGARAIDVRNQLGGVPNGTDLAMLSVSANDASHGTSPSDLQDDLDDVLKELEARGVARVILSTTPNFRTTPALPWMLNRVFAGRAEALTRTIRAVAARYPTVRIADVNVEGTLSEDEYADDGFHPNAAGYAAWVRVFVRAISDRR